MDIVFGPVPSRRFGRSLGVALVPEKICNLDCLYCEVEKTVKHTVKRAPYIPAEKVLAAFREKYPSMREWADVVMVTGAGEPTLNSDLEIIAQGIKEISSRPVAILTNSTTMHLPEVVRALNLFDIVVPSLDAVAQSVFEAVDRPPAGMRIEDIILSLTAFSRQYRGKLILELLLVKGVNDSPEDLRLFAQTAREINYQQIQVGTVFRPPAWEGVERVSDEELEKACLFLAGQDLRVSPVGLFAGRLAVRTDPDQKKTMAKSILAMRPATLRDIAEGLAIPLSEAEALLESITAEEAVAVHIYENEKYYSL